MLATRRLGNLSVSAVGMGAMTLTQVAGFDTMRGVRTIHAALDAGVTLFDTADSYGPSSAHGVNELALISALRAYPGALDNVVIATKGGHTRHENASWWIDGSAEYLARAARDSASRLGLDSLPLYQHHRPDPKIDYAESMGAMHQLVVDGVVQRVGISNVNAAQLKVALEILGDDLVSVQNEYSPSARSQAPIVHLCERHGLAFLAWGPLGGMRAAKGLGEALGAFAAIGQERGVSPQRVAIAWALAVSPALIPIPGASRPESVLDTVAALELELTPDELCRLDGGS